MTNRLVERVIIKIFLITMVTHMYRTSYADEYDASNSMDMIEEGLYLGSIDAALDEALMRREGISHVLSAIENINELQKYDGFTYKHMKLYDFPDENIIRFIPEAISFISEGMRSEKVLVHCLMGISRSSSIITSYIMVKKSICFAEAYEFVKSKRPCIGPNQGFISQISSLDVHEYQRYLE